MEAPRLIEAIGTAKALIADKGYDSDAVIALAKSQGMIPVISQNPRRINPLAIDTHVYKERHLVENFFQRIKRSRRVATRFDKTAVCFLAFVHLASVLVWLA